MFTQSLFSARPARVVLGFIIALASFGSFAASSGPATAANVATFATAPEIAAAYAAATWAKLTIRTTPSTVIKVPTTKPATASKNVSSAAVITHHATSAI
ncbi:MAG: hypothetical protein H0X24_16005, partial [Ktedonobacterales bacterium]|nr:hypothetical protein [Ktedonobacterales bacterium]